MEEENFTVGFSYPCMHIIVMDESWRPPVERLKMGTAEEQAIIKDFFEGVNPQPGHYIVSRKFDGTLLRHFFDL